jgi:phage shock protein C
VPERLFERSSDDRVVAGVCGGIAARLAVDATLVRLVFAILALAGGSGVLVYLALWIYARRGRALPAAVLFAVAAAAILYALGLSTTAVLGAALLVAGSVTVLARGGSLRPGGSLPRIGVAMLIAGAVIFLGHRGASGSFIAPGAVTGALVLIVGPWLWQLTSERADRIRRRASLQSHAGRSANFAAGSTAAECPMQRALSPRSPTPRRTSRSCTASRLSSQAQATLRWTTAHDSSCWRRAKQ